MVADKFGGPIIHTYILYIRIYCMYTYVDAKAHCTIKWYESNLVMVILFIQLEA